MHTNIQSVNGRISFFNAIVKTLTVNETNLKGRNKLKLEGYNSYNRNRINANMGGISTCVKEKHSLNTLKVSEGKHIEYIITRHSQFSPAVNVINIYGSQESRLKAEEISEEWEEIMMEIVKI